MYYDAINMYKNVLPLFNCIILSFLSTISPPSIKYSLLFFLFFLAITTTVLVPKFNCNFISHFFFVLSPLLLKILYSLAITTKDLVSKWKIKEHICLFIYLFIEEKTAFLSTITP